MANFLDGAAWRKSPGKQTRTIHRSSKGLTTVHQREHACSGHKQWTARKMRLTIKVKGTKELVREQHEALAANCQVPAGTAQSSCPAPTLYDKAKISDLPGSVIEVALGCGDPTAMAGLEPGETVLDLGSGGGIDCFLAARIVGPGGHVIGIDMTAGMLELAQRCKTQIGATNVDFCMGDIELLPLASEIVDVIISNNVINLAPDKEAVFRETFRVLKPSGRLVVCDMMTDGRLPKQLEDNVYAWGGCVNGVPDQEFYLQTIRQAGFRDVAVVSRTSYGLEDINSIDAESRCVLTRDVDWSILPETARLNRTGIMARKPEGYIQTRE